MIDSSSLFQSKIGDDSRTFRAEFLYNSQLIECSVKSVTIYKGSCGTSEFSPGAVFCPYIEAVIDDCNEILEGKELELRIGIMTNDDLSNPLFDYITMGFFTVGKPMTNTNRTTFIAQGRIAAKLSDYLDTVYTPVTIGTIAQQIEDDTGVTVVFDSGIDLNTPVSSAYLENAESPGITYREALGIAAFVIGGYATETADGMIRVCKFGNTVTSQTSAEDMQAHQFLGVVGGIDEPFEEAVACQACKVSQIFVAFRGEQLHAVWQLHFHAHGAVVVELCAAI